MDRLPIMVMVSISGRGRVRMQSRTYPLSRTTTPLPPKAHRTFPGRCTLLHPHTVVDYFEARTIILLQTLLRLRVRTWITHTLPCTSATLSPHPHSRSSSSSHTLRHTLQAHAPFILFFSYIPYMHASSPSCSWVYGLVARTLPQDLASTPTSVSPSLDVYPRLRPRPLPSLLPFLLRPAFLLHIPPSDPIHPPLPTENEHHGSDPCRDCEVQMARSYVCF